MSVKPRVVFDTNVLISALLIPRSVPAEVVRWTLHSGELLISEAIVRELHEVIHREKFDRYYNAG